ncbi:MAG: hypothetical protein ACM3TR_01735 [Caulobacteraceae bacterium]
MRGTRGKLITVFNPYKHGAGSTTIANGLGICLGYYTGKKVLLVNKSGCWSSMERFIEGDIHVQYTIDNLKVYNSSIKGNTIKTYATMINENLYMVAGSTISNEAERHDYDFEERFIEESVKAFDIVVADVPSGVKYENAKYIEKADIIIAVVKYNEIDLDDIYESAGMSNIRDCLSRDNTHIAVNFMDKDWDMPKETERLKKKYGLGETYGFAYDGSVINACCKKRKMYSYLCEELGSENNIFPQQLKEFTDMLMGKLGCCSIEKHKKGIFDFLLRSRRI